jgi:hypothetical protein
MTVGKAVSRICAAVAPPAVGNAKFPVRARVKSPLLHEGTERFNLLVSRLERQSPYGPATGHLRSRYYIGADGSLPPDDPCAEQTSPTVKERATSSHCLSCSAQGRPQLMRVAG